jgi:hypothetical protein
MPFYKINLKSKERYHVTILPNSPLMKDHWNYAWSPLNSIMNAVYALYKKHNLISYHEENSSKTKAYPKGLANFLGGLIMKDYQKGLDEWIKVDPDEPKLEDK